MASQRCDPTPSAVHARERIIAQLRALEPELRRRGVAGLGLFGSLARDEADLDSDIDLLLRPAPGRLTSLLDLSDVRLFVTDNLGCEAAVVVEEDVSPAFTARITGDLVTVY